MIEVGQRIARGSSLAELWRGEGEGEKVGGCGEEQGEQEGRGHQVEVLGLHHFHGNIVCQQAWD